jgi:DNA-binding NarL/FixJ family response regulator
VIRAGAKGYLLKNLEGEQLCQVIKTAAMGGPLVFSPEVAQALTGALPTGKADLKIAGFVSSPGLKLTARELEVLRLLAKGYANKQIAYELRLSEKTVKLHISILLSKLGVQNRSQAAIVATQMGIVASSPFEEKVEQSELTSS